MFKGKTKEYKSYGGFYRSKAEIFYPQNIEELKAIIEFAAENQRKITIAGAFHSFDNQNSGSDIVISLKRIHFINFDNQSKKIEVGPGVSWGEILKTAYTNDCVPFICITGSQPTAGGTLSAHTNNVFSPSLGKEGKYCIEFDLFRTDGKLITCSRTQNSEIFFGAISGFGLLGFITRIKYQLFYVGSPYQIDISIKNHDNILDLENKFDLRATEKIQNLEDLKSQSSLFYFDGKNPKVAIFNRVYKKTNVRETKVSKQLYLSAIATFGIRFFPNLANSIMIADEKKPAHKKTILKGLHTYYYGTFWAQPDYLWMRYTSKWFGWLGYQPKLYQNSYFIPNEGNNFTIFTKYTCDLMQEYGLQAAMFDCMYIPKDEPFILSPSRYSDGFYINTTFFDTTNVKNMMLFYQKLNQICLDMNGKMNLVKNLFVDPSILEKMNGKEIEEMIKLKKQTDPLNLIQSNFFKQKFPTFFSNN